MKLLNNVISHFRSPYYFFSTAISSFIYFIATTVVLRLIGYPPRPLQIISEQPLVPEPLETPLYVLSFITVPFLGFLLYTPSRFILSFFSSLRTRTLLVGGAILVGVLAALYLLMSDFLPIRLLVEYLKTHSLLDLFLFVTTKRIYIASLILFASGVVWIVGYLLKIKINFTRLAGEKTERMIKKVLPFALVLMVFVLYHPNLPYDQHHHNYMIGAVNDIYHGKYFLYESFNLYGVLNVYFLAAILSVLPFTYQAFTLILYVTYILYFLGIFFLLSKWLKSYAWAFLGTVSSVALTYFLQISPTQSAYEFHNTGPFRYWLYVPIGLLMLRFAQTRNFWIQRIIIAISAVSIFWSFDSGIYITLATFLTFLITDLRDPASRKDYAKKIFSLILHYLISIFIVFSTISLINYQIVGSWPEWMRAIQGLLDFRSGIGMQAHPVFGVYIGIATTYILMLVWIAKKIFLKEPFNTVTLYLLLYGIFAFNYYIGFSVWQLLYYSTPPLLLLIIFFLRRASTQPLSIHSLNLASATLLSLTFFTLVILLVKIPIEFSHRDYTRLTSSLTQIPIKEQSIYQDEAMYQDALKILELYPEVKRFPIVHRRSARLLYFLKSANFFDFYELQTVVYQREIDQMVKKLESEKPPLLVIGKEKNRIIEAFENTLPRNYQKSFSLQTLDIYTPR